MGEAVVDRKKDRENSNDELRAELMARVETSKDQAKQLIHPLGQRLDSVSEMIHSERCAREMMKQGLEHQLNGVRDFLDESRVARKRDTETMTSLIHDYRQAVTDETSARIKLEEKHNENMGKLNEKIDASQRTNVEHLQDLTERIKNVSVNHNAEVQDCAQQVLQTRATAEAVQTDMGGIRDQLEERIVKLDSQFQDLRLKKPLQCYEQKCIEGIGSGLTSSTQQPIPQTSMQPPILPQTSMQPPILPQTSMQPPIQAMPPTNSLQQGQPIPQASMLPPTQTIPPMNSLQPGQSMPAQSVRMPQGVAQQIPKSVPAQQLGAI